MGEQAVELLDAFEALPPQEKQEFALEVFRRTRELPLDSGSITDEEFGNAGCALFSFLDHEENTGFPAR